jgi:RNA polymerase sigma-70 factor (ECF subfamily)
MTGDRPAAFVPAATGRSPLLARAAGGEAIERLRERRLVRDVQRGSAEALEELFRREWPRAYRAAYLVVHDAAAAEDIAQEAFLAAIRSIDRFDRRRDSAEAPPDPRGEPFSGDVVAGLRELSPEHRAVVVLRFLFDYTPGEIARALDMPRGTVNSRLRRALDRLGEVLEP